MNEAKHTPGPWTYPLNEGHTGQEVWKTGKCKGEIIYIAHAPEKADARLIAAAPDLLSALESLAVWRDDEPCFCHVHGEGEPMHRHLVPPHVHDDYCDKARAAIAKARGAV